MNSISLESDLTISYTLLSDLFVERYMPSANGEFVKIYIYLLRAIQRNATDFSIGSVADVFSCTEKDVLRALLFWEKQGLLKLGRNQKKEIVSVRVPDRLPEENAAEKGSSAKYRDTGDASVTNDRRRTLLKEHTEEVKAIFTIAESYIGTSLSTTDMNRLLYLYDELHMSVNLIDYLVEYCVSKGKRSTRYIERVGMEWYNDHITTVREAKERSKLWDPNYYKILQYFGIRNRDPLPSESELMKRWLHTYGFSTEVIREACIRALNNTEHQTPAHLFAYTDSILKNWNSQHITTLEQVRAADRIHEKERASSAGKTSAGGGTEPAGARRKKNAFNDFHQRTYDYGDLERRVRENQAKNDSGPDRT